MDGYERLCALPVIAGQAREAKLSSPLAGRKSREYIGSSESLLGALRLSSLKGLSGSSGRLSFVDGSRYDAAIPPLKLSIWVLGVIVSR